MTDTRAIVLEILLENEKDGTFISVLIKNVLDKYSFMDRRDRAFIKTLTEGTVENRIALDYCIDKVSSVKTEKMKPAVRAIIRMGAYQLYFMDHVPDSAVCNEAVKLAKLKHLDGLTGFVNGVLRSIARQKGSIIYPDIETEYSCPKWIAGMFRRDYGKERAECIIKSFAEHPALYIRVNTVKTDADGLLKILKEQGVEAEYAPIVPDKALVIKSDFVPGESEAFRNGLFTIQDLSSVTALNEAGIRPGMYVMDLCAAPGGKTTFAAELINGSGSVRAFDQNEEKVRYINENVSRLGLSCVSASVHDACTPDEENIGKADAVIADLPCSGLGVIRRKADIRYRVKYEDIAALQELQRKILMNAAMYVKDGGRLIFSTCTVTREETSDQAEYIENDLHMKKLKERQFLPGIDPCDGFYYAVFQKSGELK